MRIPRNTLASHNVEQECLDAPLNNPSNTHHLEPHPSTCIISCLPLSISRYQQQLSRPLPSPGAGAYGLPHEIFRWVCNGGFCSWRWVSRQTPLTDYCSLVRGKQAENFRVSIFESSLGVEIITRVLESAWIMLKSQDFSIKPPNSSYFHE